MREKGSGRLQPYIPARIRKFRPWAGSFGCHLGTASSEELTITRKFRPWSGSSDSSPRSPEVRAGSSDATSETRPSNLELSSGSSGLNSENPKMYDIDEKRFGKGLIRIYIWTYKRSWFKMVRINQHYIAMTILSKAMIPRS